MMSMVLGVSFAPPSSSNALPERLSCLGSSRTPFTKRIPSWVPASKSLNGGAGMRRSKPCCCRGDCITATGSDETLAEIRKKLSSRTRFLGYGHQVSFGYIGLTCSQALPSTQPQIAPRTTWSPEPARLSFAACLVRAGRRTASPRCSRNCWQKPGATRSLRASRAIADASRRHYRLPTRHLRVRAAHSPATRLCRARIPPPGRRLRSRRQVSTLLPESFHLCEAGEEFDGGPPARRSRSPAGFHGGTGGGASTCSGLAMELQPGALLVCVRLVACKIRRWSGATMRGRLWAIW